MYRQSPVRNHRSKGIKIKHVSQICLLLAVCFWLIYQVKHSHDKKKDFDENAANFPIKTESTNELVKLGRKDLHPRIEELDTVNEKLREEQDDESVDEEGNKSDEEDQQEENKAEGKNDERRENGDDEVDNRDQEKSDVEVDREEDIDDVDKDREVNENESEERDSDENDSQVEDENSLEDRDHDEDPRSSHEAREEQYNADDASNAVTQDTEVTTAEKESGSLKLEAEHAEGNVSESKTGVDNRIQINAGQNTTASKAEDGETDGEGSPPDATNSEENGADPISSNSTNTSVSKSARTEGLTDNSESKPHLTEVSTQMHHLSLQNGTQVVSQDHNVTADDKTSGSSNVSISSPQKDSDNADTVDDNQTNSNQTISAGGSNVSISSTQKDSDSADIVDDNQTNSNPAISSKTDVVNSNLVDSSNVSGTTEFSPAGNVTVGSLDNVGLPLKDKNATEVGKTDTSGETGTTDKGVDTSIAENLVEVQHDPIDTNDSSTHLEEKTTVTDLETPPEIQIKRSNTEDAAAE